MLPHCIKSVKTLPKTAKTMLKPQILIGGHKNATSLIQFSQKSNFTHSEEQSKASYRNIYSSGGIYNNRSSICYNKNDLPFLINVRSYSTPQKSNSFPRRLLENMREDPNAKEIRKNLEEFQKQMEEYGKTDTVIKAREKYQKIESETVEGTEKAKQQLKKMTEDIKQKAQSNEVFQKAGKVTSSAREHVQKVGVNISQKGEEFAKTETFKKVSNTARVLKTEFESASLPGAGAQVYSPPLTLRMRVERNPEADKRVFEANTTATGMVFHKTANVSSTWENFKENNKYMNKVVNMKTKLEESDNNVIRATFFLKEKLTEIAGRLMSGNEISESLTEIIKVDPEFDQDKFLLELEYDIIPNILEAYMRPDMAVLKDWTSEKEFQQKKQQLHSLATLGHIDNTRVLDVDNVDLLSGGVSPEGPYLIYTFSAQIVNYVSDEKGELVSGNPSIVMKRSYCWVMLRDQENPIHRTAWKLQESLNYGDSAQMI